MPAIINRQRLLLLAICLVFSVGATTGLYWISLLARSRPNAFIRSFPPHLTTPERIVDLRVNSWYVAGGTSKKIYLGNAMAPSLLIVTDTAFRDTTRIRLKFVREPILIRGINMVTVDSPFIFLMEGALPLMLRGNLSDLTIDRERAGAYFDVCTPVSVRTSIARIWDSRKQQNVLARIFLDSDSVVRAENSLEKQQDGIFSTDGMLAYDDSSKRVVYVYFYRNRVSCFDTSLNLLYRSRTIDTISHAQLTLGRLNSQGDMTLAKPPLFVNKLICAANGLLFVRSALKANNEEASVFHENSVIDVYWLRDGHYRFSFYLPDFSGNKIRSFRVIGHRLLAIYDRYLYSYHLEF
ncbi:MAG TPA: hypothetical protein VMH27_05345 [Puia sp.]|nr:hypothetical protein [Puia sp.]